MKSDINGCSTCSRGVESFEEYYSDVIKKKLVQYDYRHPTGRLFSCISPTVEKARQRREKWELKIKAT